MIALHGPIYQTAVEGKARLLWDSASGQDNVLPSIDQNFLPSQISNNTRSWSSKPDKLTSEKIFEAVASAKIWYAKVAMKLDRATRDRIFRQLDNLHNEDDWFEGDNPILLESFKSFVKAIIAGVVGGKPGLSLTPLGNLVALWSDEQAKLAIEFQTDNVARFVWRQVIDGELERTAGVIPVHRLPAFLAPLEAKGWFVGR